MGCDFVEFIGQTPSGARSLRAFQPFPERPGDRLGLGLPGKPGERGREFVRFPATDVECHMATRIHMTLHVVNPGPEHLRAACAIVLEAPVSCRPGNG